MQLLNKSGIKREGFPNTGAIHRKSTVTVRFCASWRRFIQIKFKLNQSDDKGIATHDEITIKQQRP